jgi:hypothetical protein
MFHHFSFEPFKIFQEFSRYFKIPLLILGINRGVVLPEGKQLNGKLPGWRTDFFLPLANHGKSPRGNPEKRRFCLDKTSIYLFKIMYIYNYIYIDTYIHIFYIYNHILYISYKLVIFLCAYPTSSSGWPLTGVHQASASAGRTPRRPPGVGHPMPPGIDFQWKFNQQRSVVS